MENTVAAIVARTAAMRDLSGGPVGAMFNTADAFSGKSDTAPVQIADDLTTLALILEEPEIQAHAYSAGMFSSTNQRGMLADAWKKGFPELRKAALGMGIPRRPGEPFVTLGDEVKESMARRALK